ncbi:hypothetical protein FRB90_009620 [Tulasnella sp. 427]|nr:hypothetical protein FRB90_009620 [Tulasnella sp. 427]
MVFWFKNSWSAVQPRSEKSKGARLLGNQQGRFIYLPDPADRHTDYHWRRHERRAAYADSDTETLASDTSGSTLVNSHFSHGRPSTTAVGTHSYRGSMFPPSPHSIRKRPSLEFGLKRSKSWVQPFAVNWWLHREPSQILFHFDVRRPLEQIKQAAGYACDFNQPATTTPLTSVTILYREHTTIDTIENKSGVTINQVLKRIAKTLNGKMDPKTGQRLPHALNNWQKNAVQGFHPDGHMRLYDLMGDRVLFAGLTPADPALIHARYGDKPHKISNVFVAEFELITAPCAL